MSLLKAVHGWEFFIGSYQQALPSASSAIARKYLLRNEINKRAPTADNAHVCLVDTRCGSTVPLCVLIVICMAYKKFVEREQNSSGHSLNISNTQSSPYLCHSVIRHKLKDVVHASLWFFWKVAQCVLIYTMKVWGLCSHRLTVMMSQHNERAYDQHNWCGRGHHIKDYHWSIAKHEANPHPQGWFPTQKSFATVLHTLLFKCLGSKRFLYIY